MIFIYIRGFEGAALKEFTISVDSSNLERYYFDGRFFICRLSSEDIYVIEDYSSYWPASTECVCGREAVRLGD